MTRAGIIAVVGKPNAGKSTLLNRIIGQKLSITSPKPQSTRDRILGIHTTDDVQLIIADTPGLLAPQYALQRAMRAAALSALADADVIAYLVEASELDPPTLEVAAGLDAPPRAPVITVCNAALSDPPTSSSPRAPARESPSSSSASAHCSPRVPFSIRRTTSGRNRCASSRASSYARPRSSNCRTKSRTA